MRGLPEIREGDDLARLISGACPTPISSTDTLVVAHKVVSKAEGRTRALSEVRPGERALALAGEHGKDARVIQVILDESAAILRADAGRLICQTHHGLVCANAGVDASNTASDDEVVLLPLDPDRSARAMRDALHAETGAWPAVLISDSFGRAWRLGQTDVAIGAAGISPLEDWRGREDSRGRKLSATMIAVADSTAAAADLARTKDGRQPVVLVRGLGRWISRKHGPGAAALRRPLAEDLFR